MVPAFCLYRCAGSTVYDAEDRKSLMLPRIADLALTILMGMTFAMTTFFIALAISICCLPHGLIH